MQHRAQVLESLLRARVGLGLRWIRVHNQVELAGQVVDDGQFFGQQKLDVGHIQVVRRRRVLQLVLDLAHGVITEIACQAAAEARHAWAERHLVARLEFSDEIERIVGYAFDDFAMANHFNPLAIRAQQRRGRQADEGVAPEALAAHHGFQQEGVLALVLGLGELQVERKGCFEVGESFGDQRNTVIAFRGQRFEFEFGHVSLRGRHCTWGGWGISKTCRYACAPAAGDDQRIRLASVATARPRRRRAVSA